MKFCKDCIHYKLDGRLCVRWKIQSPETGEVEEPRIYAGVERITNARIRGSNTPNPCGPDGIHWEDKPAPPIPAPAKPEVGKSLRELIEPNTSDPEPISAFAWRWWTITLILVAATLFFIYQYTNHNP